MLDYFDSRVLTGVINRRPPLYSLISQMFFTPRPASHTDKFELALTFRGNDLLPLVREEEPGRVVSSGSAEVVMVKAPRIRVKTPFSANDLLKNPPGYNPYEIVADPVEQRIVEDLDELRRGVDRTTEWMAAQIATKGKLTVSDTVGGKTVPIYTLDNRMPDEHRPTLTGADKWSAAQSSIVKNLEEWALLIQEACGTSPTELILGKNVWEAFFNHKDVKNALDVRRIDLGELSPRVQSFYKGTFNGLRVWVYVGNVTGYNGQVEYLLDPDSVLLGARDAGQVIEYGRPLDLKCEAPARFFVKTYDEEDPSGKWLLVESRPLPWARQPGAFVCAKVL